MPSGTAIRMEFEKDVEAVIVALRSEMSSPSNSGERLLPTRVRLGGSLGPGSVSLFRTRGGVPGMVRFDGALSSEGGRTILAGSIAIVPSVFWATFLWALVMIAGVALSAPLWGTRGAELLVAMAAGVAAIVLAAVVKRFVAENRKAEGELLVDHIERAVSRDGSVAVRSRFEAGQAWHYITRPHETGSLAIVGRVEEHAGSGIIVHAKLVGLSIRNPAAPGGISAEVGHVPMLEAAFSASVTELAGTDADLSQFDEGYETWRAGISEGAGAFSKPLAEVVGYIESALNP